MNFDLFCNKQEKKLVTAITFAYDVEITQIICQKNREKNPTLNPPGFTRSAIHRFLKFQKKKNYFKQTIFRNKIKKNSKNSKKLKNSKNPKKTQKCITKKIVECFLTVSTFLNFLDFLSFLNFFEVF